jgi:glyoxylase-like metal-dependent hydrolase (beta-lactamase superfamily II)
MIGQGRRRLLRVTIVGTVVLGMVLAAALFWPRRSSTPPARTATAKVRLESKPTCVADGIYLLGNMSPSAVYVVDTDDGLVMIDSGLEHDHGKLLEALVDLGLELGRLKIILLTHAHGDHTMGAKRLKQKTGAKIYIGQDDAAPLRRGGPWEAIFSKFDMDGVTLHPTPVDGKLTDGETLTLGESHFTAIATPGHTPGSFCFLLEKGGKRALFTGDTIMSLSDGLGTYSAYLSPKFRGSASDYLGSLRKLAQLPPPDLLLPGHPQSDTIPQDPRLTADEWRDLLQRGITELQSLTERYATDGANFLDGTAKRLADGLYYLGDFDDRASYGLIQDSALLVFDPPASADSAELLDAAWKRLGVTSQQIAVVLLTSCRRELLSGLRPLIERDHCRVLTSPAGIDTVALCCPGDTSILSSDDLATLNWEVRGWLIPGADETAVAYSFHCGHSKVLVSGDMPFDIDEATAVRIRPSESYADWQPDRFLASLEVLRPIQPNIWLSATPLHGRNANLYGPEWTRLIVRNRQLARPQ